MRVVIDLQGAQTSSRKRGIGRYCLELAKAVVRINHQHEVILLLSGLFPETIPALRSEFKGLIPNSRILVWTAPPMVTAERYPSSDKYLRHIELIREDFIFSLKPDLVHVSSLFEGFVDSGVTHVGELQRHAIITTTLFDLIPLHEFERNKKSESRFKRFYFKKLEELCSCHGLMAISDYVVEDFRDRLPDADLPIVNISTGCSTGFYPLPHDAPAVDATLGKYSIKEPFILSVGAGEERKNFKLLIQAYSELPTELKKSHTLVVTGEANASMSAELNNAIQETGLSQSNVQFLGWVTDDELQALYSTCSAFVFASDNEGFGLPPLEAMQCGAPVIVSDATSLPGVVGPDGLTFTSGSVTDLSSKLKTILSDQSARHNLAERGIAQSSTFSWDKSAAAALAFWEQLYTDTSCALGSWPGLSLDKNALISRIAKTPGFDDLNTHALAGAVAQNARNSGQKQLLVDISELYHRDAATGIQRVVKNHLRHLPDLCPSTYQVLPVYFKKGQGYCYAPYPTLGNSEPLVAQVDVHSSITWERGDIFLCLDLHHEAQISSSGFFDQARAAGLIVFFVIYDLLPIKYPSLFHNDQLKALHEQLLNVVLQSDGAFCISEAVADDLRVWVSEQSSSPSPYFRIQSYTLGADYADQSENGSSSGQLLDVLPKLAGSLTFLCVSTIEPRKKQDQILAAMDLLWKSGIDVNLVLVGKRGWGTDELLSELEEHAELNRRLFWLEGISDIELSEVYQVSACVIGASIDEGFGLPLIEAARFRTPLLVRDIPVFREVAGNGATYFTGTEAEDLADAINRWISKHDSDQLPKLQDIKILSWKASTQQLLEKLISQAPNRQLLVEVTETQTRVSATGVERVVTGILKEWLKKPPRGFRVQPVYSDMAPSPVYRYAEGFRSKLLGKNGITEGDLPIEFGPGDVFFSAEVSHHAVRVQIENLSYMQSQGVFMVQMVHDLLPIEFPEFFSQEHNVSLVHQEWLGIVRKFDSLISVSAATQAALGRWLGENPCSDDGHVPSLSYSHNGCAFEASSPLSKADTDAIERTNGRTATIEFLMVGTLEPRKGYEQALDAFQILWLTHPEISLTVVGGEGWKCGQIKATIENLQRDGAPLTWLDNCDDATLADLYATSSCLLAASYAEGFGLPLVEAAVSNLAIMARDIPVFREVAGDTGAFFFKADTSQDLRDAITAWLALFETGSQPRSHKIPVMSWEDSANAICNLIDRSIAEADGMV